MEKKSGIELIAIERQEQIDKHGRTIIKDVSENSDGQLRWGATALIGSVKIGSVNGMPAPRKWDQTQFEKMQSKPQKERLIIAGALIAAEIDRLQALE